MDYNRETGQQSLIFAIDINEIIPGGITKQEYLNSMEESSPYKEILDEAFNVIKSLATESVLSKIFKSLNSNAKVQNVIFDVSEYMEQDYAIPIIDVVIVADEDLDSLTDNVKDKFMNEFFKNFNI